MPISFACEKCGKRYRVEDSAAGKRGQCKQCGQNFTVPSLPSPVDPPPKAPPTPRVQRPIPVAAPARPRRLPTSCAEGRNDGGCRCSGLSQGLPSRRGAFAIYLNWRPSQVADAPAGEPAKAPAPPPKVVSQPALVAGEPGAAPAQVAEKKPVAATGEIRRFEGHTDGVMAVAISPDGRRGFLGRERQAPSALGYRDGQGTVPVRGGYGIDLGCGVLARRSAGDLGRWGCDSDALGCGERERAASLRGQHGGRDPRGVLARRPDDCHRRLGS